MSSELAQTVIRQKPRRKTYSSTPKSNCDSIISEPQPVTLVNDFDKPVITTDLYLYAQQFFFHDEPNSDVKIENKLITIKQTNNSELIIATDHGQIGILERNQPEAK